MSFKSKLLYFIIMGAILSMCTQKKEDNPSIQKSEQGRIFGLYLDTAGKWQPALIFVVRGKSIQIDSTTGKDKIVFQEVFGVDRLVNATTPDGKLILDSITKKPRLTITPIQISKDSVMVSGIEGILIDSLSKRK